jgi:protein-S-isoprenylcysteine O-methyltransferase Ste14
MDPDQIFRRVLIAGAVAVFPIAFYHRVKSQATGEKLDRWQEGPFILFTLRPVGLAAMAGLLAYMIRPASMAWSSLPMPLSLRWTGVGLGVLGGSLLIWTFRSLGANLTDTVVTRKAHTLITTGPYRWVRHPFYDAAALSILGNGLAAANWFLLLAGGTTILLLVVRTRTEEAHLLARFGDAYRRYMQETGRFLPKGR